MLLAEPSFLSIQGEGKLTGMPMVFTRMAGCDPPFCKFCDQKSAQKGGEELGPIFVQSKIKKLAGKGIRWACFTGGEPLLQQEDLMWTIRYLKPEFYVTVETAGRIKPSNELSDLVDFWSISPKLSNSGRAAPDKHVLQELIFQIPSSADFQLKFVVGSIGDMREAYELAAYLRGGRVPYYYGRMFFQPEYSAGWRRKDFAETVLSQFPEFRVSLQMHRILGIK